jgi:hypothetical protein
VEADHEEQQRAKERRALERQQVRAPWGGLSHTDPLSVMPRGGV